jgi:hypothetical protein
MQKGEPWTAGQISLKTQGSNRKNQGLLHKVEGHICNSENCRVLFANTTGRPAEGLRWRHVACCDWLR